MSLLVLTSALHYLSVIPILYNPVEKRSDGLTRIYLGIIFLATTTSIIWHSYNEPANFLLTLDYVFAVFWFILDYLWSKCIDQPIILELNIHILLMHIISMFYSNYGAVHSVWHIMSATKCVYVSYLIYISDKK